MRLGTTAISRVRRLEVHLHAFCLGTVWRLKVSFALCRSSQGRTCWYAWNRRLCGVQGLYGCKKKNTIVLAGKRISITQLFFKTLHLL